MRTALIAAGLVTVAVIAGWLLHRHMKRSRQARRIGEIGAGINRAEALGLAPPPAAGMDASSGMAVPFAVEPPKNVPLSTNQLGSPGLRLMRQV